MSKSSLHQAAVILKSLPKQQAAKILSRLEAEDIKTVLNALDTVDRVSASEVSAALQELADSTGRNIPKSTDQSLGEFFERLESVSPRGKRQSSKGYRPFGFMADLRPEIQLQLLEDEHPRNIAMVLAEMDSSQSSSLVREFEPALRVSILRRLCDTESVAREEKAELSYALKLRLKKILNKNSYDQAGVNSVADMLSCSDEGTKEEIMAHLTQTDPDLAKKVSKSVITFEDLESADDEEIQELLAKADTTLWAPALRRASNGLRNKVLSNMAELPSKMLSREISTIGPVDEYTANRAQQRLINLVLRIRRSRIDGKSYQNPAALQITSPFYIET